MHQKYSALLKLTNQLLTFLLKSKEMAENGDTVNAYKNA